MLKVTIVRKFKFDIYVPNHKELGSVQYDYLGSLIFEAKIDQDEILEFLGKFNLIDFLFSYRFSTHTIFKVYALERNESVFKTTIENCKHFTIINEPFVFPSFLRPDGEFWIFSDAAFTEIAMYHRDLKLFDDYPTHLILSKDWSGVINSTLPSDPSVILFTDQQMKVSAEMASAMLEKLRSVNFDMSLITRVNLSPSIMDSICLHYGISPKCVFIDRYLKLDYGVQVFLSSIEYDFILIIKNDMIVSHKAEKLNNYL